MDETGRRHLSGINCTPELAQKSFLATKNLYGKANGTFFYQYVQSFSPKEEVTPAEAHQIAQELAERFFPGCEVLVATHIDGTPALSPDRQLRPPGHRKETALHAKYPGANAEGQRPDLHGARPHYLEAIPAGSAHSRSANWRIPGGRPRRQLEVPADHHNRGSYEARRDARGVPAWNEPAGLSGAVGGGAKEHHLHHAHGKEVQRRQTARAEIQKGADGA